MSRSPLEPVTKSGETPLRIGEKLAIGLSLAALLLAGIWEQTGLLRRTIGSDGTHR